MAVYTLEIEDNYDFELIGISSHEKDYRLAWALNKRMDWKMIRIADVLIEQKNSVSSHAQFRYLHQLDHTIITMIDNNTPGGYLLPDASQFDYLIKIENARVDLGDVFLRKIKSAQFVLAAFELNIDKLKSKQNLLYEYR